jgi:long-subunit fatty acid transport protein
MIQKNKRQKLQMRKLLKVALLLSAQLGLSHKTFAFSFENYSAVQQARGTAMANLVDIGASSVFFHPALMNKKKGHQLYLGHSIVDFQLDNFNTYHRDQPLSGIARQTQKNEDLETLVFLNAAFKWQFLDNVAIGLGMNMPANALARVSAVTAEDASYLRYDDRRIAPEFVTSFSHKLSKGFSYGGGLIASFKAKGNVQLAASQEDADSRLLMELKPVFIPFLSSAITKEWDNHSQTIIAFQYRLEHQTKSQITVDVAASTRLANVPFNAESSLVPFYEPHAFLLSAAQEFQKINFYGSLDYKLWSNYQGPIIDLKGKDIEDLTAINDQNKQFHLKDTYTASLGTKIKNIATLFGGEYSQLFGVSYRPSVLKENLTSIAVLDAKEKALATGGEWSGTIFEKHKITLDWSLRATFLENKKVQVLDSRGIKKIASLGGKVIDLGAGIHVDF